MTLKDIAIALLVGVPLGIWFAYLLTKVVLVVLIWGLLGG
jgi:hypothetical protein